MIDVRYFPARGTWLAIAAEVQLLMIEQKSDDDKLERLWLALQSSPGAQPVLDELTRGGISLTPSFVLLSWPAGIAGAATQLGVVARGDVDVTVRTNTGRVEIDGRGVSTWTERTVSDVIGLEVQTSVPRDKRSGDSGALRLVEGMAWVSGIQVGGSPAPAEAQGVREPAPVPKEVREREETAVPVVVAVPEGADADSYVAVETTQVAYPDQEVVSSEATVELADTEAADTQAADTGMGYDYLFGETIVRTVEGAAIRSDEEVDELPNGSPPSGDLSVELAGDHDGKTAIGLDREARKAARRARAQVSAAHSPVSGPRLYIDLSSGDSEELDQPILIGRAPSVNKVSGGNLPRLVTITGPDQDISRNHVRVSVEGGTVVVTDLHSRNGTMIILPGRPPQQLRAGEPTAVIPGTVVDLGAEVTFSVREG